MDEITIYVEVEINPTESEDKVKQAVKNIFGNIFPKYIQSCRGRILILELKGLEALKNVRNLLRRERIRAAARRVFFRGLKEKSVIFYLNKQVAYGGHISFSKETTESPLGPIKVTIRSEIPRKIIHWLAPQT